MDLAFNDLQRLICLKINQPTNQQRKEYFLANYTVTMTNVY